ncbi:MAG: hypothetical protein WBA93_14165 [Microcoleaceae cyanobacterium]
MGYFKARGRWQMRCDPASALALAPLEEARRKRSDPAGRDRRTW